jgi:small-conductance mechanosensitive channel
MGFRHYISVPDKSNTQQEEKKVLDDFAVSTCEENECYRDSLKINMAYLCTMPLIICLAFFLNMIGTALPFLIVTSKFLLVIAIIVAILSGINIFYFNLSLNEFNLGNVFSFVFSPWVFYVLGEIDLLSPTTCTIAIIILALICALFASINFNNISDYVKFATTVSSVMLIIALGLHGLYWVLQRF